MGPVRYKLPIHAHTNHNNAIGALILQTRNDRIRVLSVPFTRTLNGLPDFRTTRRTDAVAPLSRQPPAALTRSGTRDRSQEETV